MVSNNKIEIRIVDNSEASEKYDPIFMDINSTLIEFKKKLKEIICDYSTRCISVGIHDIDDTKIQNKTLKDFCVNSRKERDKLIFPAVSITSAHEADKY